VSQRVWKAGGKAIAPLLSNVLCAASTFEHVYGHVGVYTLLYFWKGIAGSRGNFRYAVDAGHSTGGKRGIAYLFGFDAAGLPRGRTAALHVRQDPISATGRVL
jgi:hypothetical protein